jgi:hypothetical protein
MDLKTMKKKIEQKNDHKKGSIQKQQIIQLTLVMGALIEKTEGEEEETRDSGNKVTIDQYDIE